MPGEAPRAEALRARLQAHLDSLQANPPAPDAKKGAADAWAHAVKTADELTSRLERVIASAAQPPMPPGRPGEVVVACIRKGASSEVRVSVFNQRVEVRRWRMFKGAKDWTPAARAVTLDLQATDSLVVALIAARKVLQATPRAGESASPDAGEREGESAV